MNTLFLGLALLSFAYLAWLLIPHRKRAGPEWITSPNPFFSPSRSTRIKNKVLRMRMA